MVVEQLERSSVLLVSREVFSTSCPYATMQLPLWLGHVTFASAADQPQLATSFLNSTLSLQYIFEELSYLRGSLSNDPAGSTLFTLSSRVPKLLKISTFPLELYHGRTRQTNALYDFPKLS